MGCNLGQAVAFSPRPSCDPARYCEIATAPSGPRNDKLGSLMPMNLRCMICKCTRRSLSAATDAIGVYHFNGSQYESGVHRRERHAAPLQGVCGRQSAAAFPSAIRYDYAKRTAGRPSSACQKVPSGFFAKLLPELQNQFLYHDFAILPLRRVMERERTPRRFPFTLFFPPKFSAGQVLGQSEDGRAAVLCFVHCQYSAGSSGVLPL